MANNGVPNPNFKGFIPDNYYEKKGYFVIGFVTQFLSCKKHLQFTIFIGREC
jgi:hypothetical protein